MLELSSSAGSSFHVAGFDIPGLLKIQRRAAAWEARLTGPGENVAKIIQSFITSMRVTISMTAESA